MNQLKNIANSWIDQLAVYQPGRPIEDVARELGLGDPDDIVKLASNENSLGPSPKAVEAMARCAHHMHVYPDGGNYKLRQALSEKLHVEENQLFLGHGSNEIIQLLGHVFLNDASNIVMSDHAFIVYKLVAALYRADVISVPMAEGFKHDLTAMSKAITEQTRLVFIANPNNPTGTMVDESELSSFMRDVPGHTAVVIDEAYIELLPEAKRPNTLGYVRNNQNVFVLRTFSKIYGLAGLRIGYAIAPSEGVDLLHHVRQPFNVNAMAQAAALASLEDDAFVAHTRETVEQGLVQLNTAFSEMGLDCIPSSANFLLVKVGKGSEFFEALQKEKVIVRPMDVYQLPDYVRITIGTHQENQRLIDAMRNVLAAREESA